MNLLPAKEYKRLRWKNGGGTTREVAVFPPNASLDDFDWRISMATVNASGIFSSFPDIDRILTVLKGSMRLKMGTDRVLLSASSEPFGFMGDLSIAADVIEGPVEDLNVMTRRTRYDASVTRIKLDVGVPFEIDAAPITFVVCEAGEISLFGPDQALSLEPHNAAISDEAGDHRLIVRSQHEASLLVIRIEERGEAGGDAAAV